MCSWVWRPFRVQDRDVEFDEPVVEPAEAAPAPEAPPVSALVERSATALATNVWSSGAKSRDHLCPGVTLDEIREGVEYGLPQIGRYSVVRSLLSLVRMNHNCSSPTVSRQSAIGE